MQSSLYTIVQDHKNELCKLKPGKVILKIHGKNNSCSVTFEMFSPYIKNSPTVAHKCIGK